MCRAGGTFLFRVRIYVQHPRRKLYGELLGEKLPEYLSAAEPMHLGRAHRLFPQEGVFENQQLEYLPHVGGAGYLPLIWCADHKGRTGGLGRPFLAVGAGVLSTKTILGPLLAALCCVVGSRAVLHFNQASLRRVAPECGVPLGALTTALASPMGQVPSPTALIIPALAVSAALQRRDWQDQANTGLSGHPGRRLQQIR